jgi:hypothetical protein
VAQLPAVDDFDGAVARVRNEYAAAGLMNVPVVESAGSRVSWKRKFANQVERH